MRATGAIATIGYGLVVACALWTTGCRSATTPRPFETEVLTAEQAEAYGLQPGAIVHVRFIDGHGQPLHGIPVHVTTGSSTRLLHTAADGTIALKWPGPEAPAPQLAATKPRGVELMRMQLLATVTKPVGPDDSAPPR